jgi:hypothetical protein
VQQQRWAMYCRYLQISADICRYLQISADICRYLQISADICADIWSRHFTPADIGPSEDISRRNQYST